MKEANEDTQQKMNKIYSKKKEALRIMGKQFLRACDVILY
jgi:hypothetical protein